MPVAPVGARLAERAYQEVGQFALRLFEMYGQNGSRATTSMHYASASGDGWSGQCHGTIAGMVDGPFMSGPRRPASEDALARRPASPGALELVGRRVRQLRREHRLSQEELASKLRLHPNDLARMEQGDYRVSLDTLRDLMAVFEVGIGELLEGNASS